MQLLRRNSDYALRSLSFLAGLPRGKKIKVSAIAEKQDVPPHFLRKILLKLSKARIVESQSGPCGGFSLSRMPSQITLKEVLEAVQGRVSLNECLYDSNFCSRWRRCSVRPGLSVIQDKLIGLLDEYNLGDFFKL